MMKMKKKKRILLVIMCLLFMMSGCSKNSYQLDSAAKDGVFEMQDPTLMQKLQEKADESSFRIVINSNPYVDVQTNRCNLMIANPEENNRDIQVDIYLENTQEIVYQSEQIPPGERIAYDHLMKELEVGEYPAIAVFSTLDEETGEVANQFEVALLLDVKTES